MFVKDVTVANQVGLHAGPATFFIQKAKESMQNPCLAFFLSASWAERIFALSRTALMRKRLLRALSLSLKAALQSKIVKFCRHGAFGVVLFYLYARFDL